MTLSPNLHVPPAACTRCLERILTFPPSVAHEGRVLVDAASVLHSSFRELDPKYITCFSYDSITSLAQASRVAEFLMPTVESATLFSQTLLGSAKLHMEHQANQVLTEHTNGWELVANRLQEKIDEIDLNQCE